MKIVDGRDKPGHDEPFTSSAVIKSALFAVFPSDVDAEPAPLA
jgi:hypothetical protein